MSIIGITLYSTTVGFLEMLCTIGTILTSGQLRSVSLKIAMFRMSTNARYGRLQVSTLSSYEIEAAPDARVYPTVAMPSRRSAHLTIAHHP